MCIWLYRIALNYENAIRIYPPLSTGVEAGGWGISFFLCITLYYLHLFTSIYIVKNNYLQLSYLTIICILYYYGGSN